HPGRLCRRGSAAGPDRRNDLPPPVRRCSRHRRSCHRWRTPMTLATTSFDWVRKLVHKESAIVLQPGKEYLVEARLLPIARSMGLGDVGKLVDTVRTRPDPDATRRIVEALTTNETSWFRDGEPF